MIKMIVASTLKGVIGKNNSLPWHIKEELEFFKKTTINTTLLMGYNTYISLPAKLTNREIIVLTKKELKNVKTVKLSEVNKLFSTFRDSKEILFISGGKMLYENFYQEAEVIYHSIINKEYKGDTYINFNYENYTLLETKAYKEFILKVWNKNK